MSKVESVSREICLAAGKTINKRLCLICDSEDSTKCELWKEFKDEARAAIRAIERYKE
jgi:hypothetical protein